MSTDRLLVDLGVGILLGQPKMIGDVKIHFLG